MEKASLILADPRCLFWFEWGEQERFYKDQMLLLANGHFHSLGLIVVSVSLCLSTCMSFLAISLSWWWPVSKLPSELCEPITPSSAPRSLVVHCQLLQLRSLGPFRARQSIPKPALCHAWTTCGSWKYSQPQPKQLTSEQQQRPHRCSTACLPVLSSAFLRHESDANPQCPLLFRGYTQICTEAPFSFDFRWKGGLLTYFPGVCVCDVGNLVLFKEILTDPS